MAKRAAAKKVTLPSLVAEVKRVGRAKPIPGSGVVLVPAAELRELRRLARTAEDRDDLRVVRERQQRRDLIPWAEAKRTLGA